MTKREMQIRLEMAAQQMRRVLEARGLPFERMELLNAIHQVEDFGDACAEPAEADMQAAVSQAAGSTIKPMPVGFGSIGSEARVRDTESAS